jgi:hypothetical protein
VLGCELWVLGSLTELFKVYEVVNSQREVEDGVDVGQLRLQERVPRLDLRLLRGYMEPLGFPLGLRSCLRVPPVRRDLRPLRGRIGTLCFPLTPLHISYGSGLSPLPVPFRDRSLMLHLREEPPSPGHKHTSPRTCRLATGLSVGRRQRSVAASSTWVTGRGDRPPSVGSPPRWDLPDLPKSAWSVCLATTVSAVEMAGSGNKRMRLRYSGTCRVCGADLPATAEAIYERSTKTVRCAAHDEHATPGVPEPGVGEQGIPGASARREFEQRHTGREERIRAKHPRLGSLLHALSEDPQSTKAWETGALGEERLGRRLNELSSAGLLVLHDRRIPGSRANIDHLAITPTGVYVIDTKKYQGRPQLRVEGGLIRPKIEKLLIGGRDRTRLVSGVQRQVQAVRAVVSDDVAVHGVLCFVDADWPLIGGSFTVQDVEALWPKKLYPKLQRPGPLGMEALQGLHHALARAMPPA